MRTLPLALLLLFTVTANAFEITLPDGQQLLKLPVQVVDEEGEPVAGAKVIPWALRSSQGHGHWLQDDKGSGVEPAEVETDAQGEVNVTYPLYREVEERVKTLAVSLFVDHPDYGFVSDLHVNVPLQGDEPHEVRVERGVRPIVRPLIDSKPADPDSIYAIWSDGRSWRPDTVIERTDGGGLRFPAMAPGPGSVRLVRLEGEHATHFSSVVRFDLVKDKPLTIDVELRPSVTVRGRIDEGVPRPVEEGRVVVTTIKPTYNDELALDWHSWARIQPDGTFTIEAWPEDEAIQLIGLCRGYYAKQGLAPAVVDNPRDPAKDPYARAQVFESAGANEIVVPMSPTPFCNVTVQNAEGEPVEGIRVLTCPNVGWWNSGSQIYCETLFNAERLLKSRDFKASLDTEFPYPFDGITDARGRVTVVTLPGRESLVAGSDDYELPIFIGRRDYAINTVPGQTIDVTFTVQKKGTEQLGDWDKLAGVVFGCSTREGQQICAKPGVREKMTAFRDRLQSAENPRDPQLLAELYASVAEAFEDYGDEAEAANWREKSEEQAKLVK